MSLMDKLRENYVVGSLGLLLAMGCGDSTQRNSVPCGSDADCKGDRICVEGYCQGGDDSSDDSSGSGQTDIERKCQQLCDHYWNDCNGLPGANYWFGNNYGNCIEGCPAFLESYLSQETQYGEMSSKDELQCLIETGCDGLTHDACETGEGDLFCALPAYLNGETGENCNQNHP